VAAVEGRPAAAVGVVNNTGQMGMLSGRGLGRGRGRGRGRVCKCGVETEPARKQDSQPVIRTTGNTVTPRSTASSAASSGAVSGRYKFFESEKIEEVKDEYCMSGGRVARKSGSERA
jgi:hypothetical protein